MHNFHSLKPGSVDTMPKWWAEQWEFQSASWPGALRTKQVVRPMVFTEFVLKLYTHSGKAILTTMHNGLVCNFSEIWGSFCAELIFRICINLFLFVTNGNVSPQLLYLLPPIFPWISGLGWVSVRPFPPAFPSLICWRVVSLNHFVSPDALEMIESVSA